ncbi:MAG: DUF1836 domain-containing protein [Erysipelotrichaceae bacterium]|nr:DUF1836 domain-containing protein [Erysipelotrichaceae bacterium]
MNEFHVPRYEELPDFPIYIDQLIEYIENKLSVFFFDEEKIITKSMINNYVKQGIVRAPEKKKYERDQIVYIIIICILKKSFTLEEISLIIETVVNYIDIVTSYNYFCNDFEACLKGIFDKKEIVHTPYMTNNKELVYSCQCVMLTVANKVYLESIIKKVNE